MRALLIRLIIIFGLVVIPSTKAFALSKADRQAIERGTEFFDPNDTGTTCGGASTAAAAPGGVVFIGDSIGTQVQGPLKDGFTAKGWTWNSPDALAGRQLVDGKNRPDGFEILAAIGPALKDAHAVIIELGTNTGGTNPANIAKAITTIRATNPTATIYWVDTAGVQKADLAKSLSTVNSYIYTSSAQSGFSVISWNKKVFGDAADPKAINANAPDNGYIRRSDQFVHLTNEGIKAMTDLILNTVTTGGGTAAASDNQGCACASGTNLVGSDNAGKIYNYFIGKGLTPVQTSGLMGNMQAESGFNPRRVQGTHTPDGDSDTMKIDGNTGYGLVQWTFITRQRALSAFAAAAGKSVGDLGLQLDFVWVELNGNYLGGLNALKQATTTDDAVEVILMGYENPRKDLIPAQRIIRRNFARINLAKFGSVGADPSAVISGAISSCGGNGQ